MTQDNFDRRYPQVDTGPSEHERVVAEDEEGGELSGASAGLGQADQVLPSAEEDLAMDQERGDESTRGG